MIILPAKVQQIYGELMHHGTLDMQRFLVQFPVASRFMIRRTITGLQYQVSHHMGPDEAIAKVMRTTRPQVEACIDEERQYLGLGPIATAILIALLTEVAKVVIRRIIENWEERQHVT
jgi:hypothetical protein